MNTKLEQYKYITQTVFDSGWQETAFFGKNLLEVIDMTLNLPEDYIRQEIIKGELKNGENAICLGYQSKSDLEDISSEMLKNDAIQKKINKFWNNCTKEDLNYLLFRTDADEGQFDSHHTLTRFAKTILNDVEQFKTSLFIDFLKELNAGDYEINVNCPERIIPLSKINTLNFVELDLISNHLSELIQEHIESQLLSAKELLNPEYFTLKINVDMSSFTNTQLNNDNAYVGRTGLSYYRETDSNENYINELVFTPKFEIIINHSKPISNKCGCWFKVIEDSEQNILSMELIRLYIHP